ncbi:MAG: hypothetical protein A2140_04400 [Candidatus Muproteobacteria bacterium RBG_16_62_13]|uniref:PKD domain-containing protein n=1 Tax=Candidatus Muproteobacteria bacterium RBG_16_62_13 TaxID=1817756 RepID=A0A1F6T826_9PROT|nr:MAG: hypothetical protein A2140_04400 [Candidatus Muproteobacteria bacterium RBG_16_62_13]
MIASVRTLLSRAFLVFVLAVVSIGFPLGDAAAQGNPQLRISQHEHESHELLVKFRVDTAPRDAEEAVRDTGAKEIQAFARPKRLAKAPTDAWRLVRFAPGVDIEKMRARLMSNRHIEKVEYNYKVSIVLTPNDPRYPELWGLNNTGQTGGKLDADIDAPEAWYLQTGDQNVVVAVIDTGVAYDHPDLAANAWTNPGEIPANGIDDDGNGYVDDVHGYDFYNNDANPYDDHGHGTHVAGTIAAVGNNGIGVAGVSWRARIMAVKFLSAGGSGTTSGAISAVLYAADMGARVMNNSWGGGGFSQALMDAIVTADQAGALFVAAAGNSNSNNDVTPNYPSNYDVPNVLAVAATDHNDARASFSSYGATTVDLGAPGVNILSTVPTSGASCCSDPTGYKQLSGTSMATPHVSGAATLVYSQYPGITHHQVKDRLMASAEPIPALQGITVTGGRMNVSVAFEDDATPPAPVTDLAVANAATMSVTLGWGATGDDGLSGTATSYDLRHSTAPIDETNFDAATPVGPIPVTGPAGTIEIYTIQGLEPQTTYYFALKVRDNVGNLSPISNVAVATTRTVVIVFKDDFESGAGNWTIAGTDGVGGPTLWHISPHRYVSPSNAMYYGKESTLNYDTGARNYGSITSGPISLVGATDSALTFNHFLATENFSPYDTARVQVSKDNGLTWTDLFVTALNSSGMVKKSVSLAAYDNQVIRLRFSFDTVDSIFNGFEGWVIDDVLVQGDPPPPAPPSANAGGPYTGVIGQWIQFDGSGSSDPNGDPLTYVWDFGDGAAGTGIAPMHAYAARGTYTVTLMVNDGVYDSVPATTTVTVMNQVPVAVPGGPYTAVWNRLLTLNGSESFDADGDTLTYQWDLGDGTPAAGANPTHTYATPGTYTVTLVVNDGNQNSVPATTTVTVMNQVPVAAFTGPTSAYKLTMLTWNATASSDADGDVLTYKWDFGDGNKQTTTSASVNHGFSYVGTYTVTLVVNDGQVDSAPVTQTIQIASKPPVANAGPDQTVASRDIAYLNGRESYDPDGYLTSGAWRQVSGPSVTLFSADTLFPYFVAPNVKGNSPEVLVFELTVTDEDGVQSSDQVAVTVVKR